MTPHPSVFVWVGEATGKGLTPVNVSHPLRSSLCEWNHSQKALEGGKRVFQPSIPNVHLHLVNRSVLELFSTSFGQTQSLFCLAQTFVRKIIQWGGMCFLPVQCHHAVCALSTAHAARSQRRNKCRLSFYMVNHMQNRTVDLSAHLRLKGSRNTSRFSS